MKGLEEEVIQLKEENSKQVDNLKTEYGPLLLFE